MLLPLCIRKAREEQTPAQALLELLDSREVACRRGNTLTPGGAQRAHISRTVSTGSETSSGSLALEARGR